MRLRDASSPIADLSEMEGSMPIGNLDMADASGRIQFEKTPIPLIIPPTPPKEEKKLLNQAHVNCRRHILQPEYLRLRRA